MKHTKHHTVKQSVAGGTQDRGSAEILGAAGRKYSALKRFDFEKQDTSISRTKSKAEKRDTIPGIGTRRATRSHYTELKPREDARSGLHTTPSWPGWGGREARVRYAFVGWSGARPGASLACQELNPAWAASADQELNPAWAFADEELNSAPAAGAVGRFEGKSAHY